MGKQRGSLVWSVAPAAVAFALAGAAATLVSDRPGGFRLAAWQLVNGPVLGALLAVAPAAVLMTVKDKRFWMGGQAFLVTLTVWAVVAANSSDSSTSGIALMYIPVFGTICAVGLSVLSNVLDRRRWALLPPPPWVSGP